MTMSCNRYIQYLKDVYHSSWKDKALHYIDEVIKYYHEYPSLATIEVLSEFDCNAEYDEFQERFKDVFVKYQQSHFLVKNLAPDDLNYLLTRYVKEYENYREEILNVIS